MRSFTGGQLQDGLKPLERPNAFTLRQVRRQARRYAAAGPVALPFQTFGRPSNNRQTMSMRRAFGELIQIDGCEHHWCEDRGPACTALVFINDATSRLVQILFSVTGPSVTRGIYRRSTALLVQCRVSRHIVRGLASNAHHFGSI